MPRSIFFVVSMASVFAMASTAGAQYQSVAEQIRAQQKDQLQARHRESQERREAALRRSEQRRQEIGLRQFQDRNGVATFTNRPKRYESSKEYDEVIPDFKPIVVPKQYQKITSPEQYTSKNIAALIQQYAQLYGVDEKLVYAVIKHESAFNPNAVSPKGASGLMQLMPATAAEMGVTRIFDPAQNIAAGTQYLAKMHEMFGDVSLALAAYNAGPGAVSKHKGIPPYQETKGYVKNVLSTYQALGGKGGATRMAQWLASKPAGNARPALGGNPQPTSKYVVHFHSGLKQPADNVTEKPPYYYIEYGRRHYPVRKELVEKIAEAA